MCEVIIREASSSYINSNEIKNVYEVIGEREKDINTKERSDMNARNIANLAVAIIKQ